MVILVEDDQTNGDSIKGPTGSIDIHHHSMMDHMISTESNRGNPGGIYSNQLVKKGNWNSNINFRLVVLNDEW